MGVKRIPIAAAKRIAQEFGQTQVVIVTWDKDTDLTHVVTYGVTKKDCAEAALGSKRVQEALNLGKRTNHDS